MCTVNLFYDLHSCNYHYSRVTPSRCTFRKFITTENCANKTFLSAKKGVWVRVVVKHCATSRTVPGSIPGGVTGFFGDIPSDRTMALGSTQSLVKMSTRYISCGWRRPVLEADDLTTFMCRMSWKSGSLNLLESSAPHRACYGTPLPFIREENSKLVICCNMQGFKKTSIYFYFILSNSGENPLFIDNSNLRCC